MAENLRALGLDAAKPFSIMSSDYLRTKLNAGVPVANWKSPDLPYQYEEEMEFQRKQRELLRERRNAACLACGEAALIPAKEATVGTRSYIEGNLRPWRIRTCDPLLRRRTAVTRLDRGSATP